MSLLRVFLRDVQESDIPFLYQWENDEENWKVSETTKPYSLNDILDLVESSRNFEETKQKRWMIILESNHQVLGTLDIFQGDLDEFEVGIGILIANTIFRNKGIGTAALKAGVKLAVEKFNVHTFHASIHSTNLSSLKLFKKCGFEYDELDRDNSNFDSIINMSLCLKK